LQAEEEPSVVAETRAPTTPPPPALATAVEEGEAALEVPSKAGPSVEDLVILDEDSAPPRPSENHDVAAAPALEPAQVPVAMSLLPTVEVSVPSPAVEVQGPLLIAEVAESSLVRVSLTSTSPVSG
jgi:cytoskeletal protein RodZ